MLHADIIDCPGCKVVSYYSADHQAADRAIHEVLCVSIQHANVEVDAHFNELAAKCNECFVHKGEFHHLWEWRDIRSYIRAQRSLMDLLTQVATQKSLRTALDHALDILRLDMCDILDVKQAIPAIMIRLGMDVEAYQFMRRHDGFNPDCRYAWAHLHMNITQHRCQQWSNDTIILKKLGEQASLQFKVATALLQFRLLRCLRDLETANELTSMLPLEIVHLVRDNLIYDLVVHDTVLWQEVCAGKSLHDRILELEKQLQEMFRAVRTDSPAFWSALVGLQEVADPQTKIALKQSRDSWVETVGASEWVHDQLRLTDL